MFDSPIRPIRPVRAVWAPRPVTIRRRPSRGQLMAWLDMAKRAGRRVAARQAEVKPAAEHKPQAGHVLDIEI
jgi:hypothetical protein